MVGADGVPTPATLVASLTVEIGGSRWCNRVRRQHVSNGVFWVVGLEGGRAEAVQKCWDEQCRGWSSPPVEVPEEVVPVQVGEGVRVVV